MQKLIHSIVVTVVVLHFYANADAASDIGKDTDLIGWLGDTFEPNSKMTRAPEESGLVVLSWDPRIFLYKGFLSHEECDGLIQNATPRLYRSGVVDAVTGAGKMDNIRTSSGMFFAHRETPAIARIEQRIAMLTMTHVEQGEGIQVLRYDKSQKYDPHHDYFSHDQKDDGGGNRLATGLMYLSDVESGGETVFPKVPVPKEQTRAAGFSECAMKGLAYKPCKGDIVVFWSIRSDGSFDHKSLHGSCPVIKGQKWSATKWIHIAKAREGRVIRTKYVPPPPPDVPGCVNRHKLCDHWAESGECEDNPGYMIASKEKPGDCLKACNRCDMGPNELPQ